MRLLIATDVIAAATLHAVDFELITPSGFALSKGVYRGRVQAGEVDDRSSDSGEISLRAYGEAAAVLRYQGEMTMSGRTRRLWHTDLYERRTIGWQVVWSQATLIAEQERPIPPKLLSRAGAPPFSGAGSASRP